MKKFLLFFWNGFFLLKQKIADIFYLIKDFFYTRAHKAPNIMKCEDTLIDHLKEVQELANKRYNQLMDEFKKSENIIEELKQKDQMKWVGLMNNISNCVNEIVLKECIYND